MAWKAAPVMHKHKTTAGEPAHAGAKVRRGLGGASRKWRIVSRPWRADRTRCL